MLTVPPYTAPSLDGCVSWLLLLTLLIFAKVLFWIFYEIIRNGKREVSAVSSFVKTLHKCLHLVRSTRSASSFKKDHGIRCATEKKKKSTEAQNVSSRGFDSFIVWVGALPSRVRISHSALFCWMIRYALMLFFLLIALRRIDYFFFPNSFVPLHSNVGLRMRLTPLRQEEPPSLFPSFTKQLEKWFRIDFFHKLETLRFMAAQRNRTLCPSYPTQPMDQGLRGSSAPLISGESELSYTAVQEARIGREEQEEVVIHVLVMEKNYNSSCINTIPLLIALNDIRMSEKQYFSHFHRFESREDWLVVPYTNLVLHRYVLPPPPLPMGSPLLIPFRLSAATSQGLFTLPYALTSVLLCTALSFLIGWSPQSRLWILIFLLWMVPSAISCVGLVHSTSNEEMFNGIFDSMQHRLIKWVLTFGYRIFSFESIPHSQIFVEPVDKIFAPAAVDAYLFHGASNETERVTRHAKAPPMLFFRYLLSSQSSYSPVSLFSMLRSFPFRSTQSSSHARHDFKEKDPWLPWRSPLPYAELIVRGGTVIQFASSLPEMRNTSTHLSSTFRFHRPHHYFFLSHDFVTLREESDDSHETRVKASQEVEEEACEQVESLGNTNTLAQIISQFFPCCTLPSWKPTGSISEVSHRYIVVEGKHARLANLSPPGVVKVDGGMHNACHPHFRGDHIYFFPLKEDLKYTTHSSFLSRLMMRKPVSAFSTIEDSRFNCFVFPARNSSFSFDSEIDGTFLYPPELQQTIPLKRAIRNAFRDACFFWSDERLIVRFLGEVHIRFFLFDSDALNSSASVIPSRSFVDITLHSSPDAVELSCLAFQDLIREELNRLIHEEATSTIDSKGTMPHLQRLEALLESLPRWIRCGGALSLTLFQKLSSPESGEQTIEFIQSEWDRRTMPFDSITNASDLSQPMRKTECTYVLLKSDVLAYLSDQRRSWRRAFETLRALSTLSQVPLALPATRPPLECGHSSLRWMDDASSSKTHEQWNRWVSALWELDNPILGPFSHPAAYLENASTEIHKILYADPSSSFSPGEAEEALVTHLALTVAYRILHDGVLPCLATVSNSILSFVRGLLCGDDPKSSFCSFVLKTYAQELSFRELRQHSHLEKNDTLLLNETENSTYSFSQQLNESGGGEARLWSHFLTRSAFSLGTRSHKVVVFVRKLLCRTFGMLSTLVGGKSLFSRAPIQSWLGKCAGVTYHLYTYYLSNMMEWVVRVFWRPLWIILRHNFSILWKWAVFVEYKWFYPRYTRNSTLVTHLEFSLFQSCFIMYLLYSQWKRSLTVAKILSRGRSEVEWNEPSPSAASLRSPLNISSNWLWGLRPIRAVKELFYSMIGRTWYRAYAYLPTESLAAVKKTFSLQLTRSLVGYALVHAKWITALCMMKLCLIALHKVFISSLFPFSSKLVSGLSFMYHLSLIVFFPYASTVSATNVLVELSYPSLLPLPCLRKKTLLHSSKAGSNSYRSSQRSGVSTFFRKNVLASCAHPCFSRSVQYSEHWWVVGSLVVPQLLIRFHATVVLEIYRHYISAVLVYTATEMYRRVALAILFFCISLFL